MMLRSQKYLGIHFVDESIYLIEMEHNRGDYMITAIDTMKCETNYFAEIEKFSPEHPDFLQKLLQDIKVLFSRSKTSAKKISCAIDSKNLFISEMPTDNSLSQDELEDHVRWEIATNLGAVDDREFSTDLITFAEVPEKGIHEKLIISVRRNFVWSMQQIAKALGLSLNIMDVDHLCAEPALLYNYPDLTHQTIVSIGLKKNSLDFSIIRTGQCVAYSSAEFAATREVIPIISELLNEYSHLKPAKAMVHGPLVGTELLRLFREQMPLPFEVADSFKKMKFSKQLRDGLKYRRLSHHFTPAVGIAMRKS